MIKCSACNIEGIHACLGKPVKQSDLPEGIKVFDSGELTDKFREELDKYDISKLSQ